jgi:hypothetical protein
VDLTAIALFLLLLEDEWLLINVGRARLRAVFN